MATREGLLYRLPPRPRSVDWLMGGLRAGATLALAELAVVAVTTGFPPPRLGLAMLAADVVYVGTLGWLSGVVLRALSIRPTYSAMVGALIGPLLVVHVLGALAAWIASGGPDPVLAASGLVAALSCALAAGLAAGRLGELLERSGAVLAGPLVWIAVAAPVSVAAHVFETRIPGTLDWLAIGCVALLGLAVSIVATARARRLASHGPGNALRQLVLTIGAAACLALGQWIGPWLVYERRLPDASPGPPSILVTVFEDGAHGGGAAALSLLASEGVSYDQWDPPATRDSLALLTAGDGRSVVDALAQRGYATAVISAIAPPAGLLGAAEVDARPSAGGMITGPLAWTAGASLVRASGGAALRALGFDRDRRTPTELSDAAQRWLVSWHGLRAPTPFFLWIDFRQGSVGALPGAPTAGDDELSALVEQLRMLEVSDRTAVVASLEGAFGLREPPALRAVLQVPDAFARRPNLSYAEQVRPTQIGDVLLALSELAPGEPRVALPGVDPS